MLDGESEEALNEAWGGGLGFIKTEINKGNTAIRNVVNKEFTKINNQNIEAKTRDTVLDKEVKN